MRRLLIVIALLLLVITGVASAQGDTINMIVTRDPLSFDPHATIDPGAPILMSYIYDTLVYQAPDGSIQPSLATGWQVGDEGQSLTFTLREGIVFSDGSPFNADAVIFTFERLQEQGQRSLIYNEIANIADFEKIDESTVRFELATPSATLLSALTYAYAAILSPEATEAAGDTYGQTPVGTGAFTLSEWIPENSLTLVPNPNYTGVQRPWTEADAPPQIDALNVSFTTDQSARASALIAGQADIAYITSPPQLARLAAMPEFYILDSPGRSLVYAGFNTERAPFDQPGVRQALVQAINKDDVLAVASEGMGEVVDTPLPPTLLGYDAALEAEAFQYDPDAARQQLAELGYTEDNPLEITILTSTFPTFEVISTVMQQQFAAVGVNATIDVLDYSAVREMATNGDYDMLVTRYDWNDPDVLWRYLAEENIGSTNRYFYRNPALDALLLEGRAEFDPVTRSAIYAEAQQIILEEVPIIPLYMPATKVVVNNRVQGADVLHSHVVLDAAEIVD